MAKDWPKPDLSICPLCDAPGEDGQDLCPGYHTDLPWNTHACPFCVLPLPAGSAGPCADCLRRPPPHDSAFAPLLYAPPVDYLLTGFKFRARLGAGRLLGHLLAQSLARQMDVLPVPLHRTRLLGRGFYQALELARPAAKRLGLGLDTGSVRRTRQQNRLSAVERRANLRGAFRVTGDVKGLDIVLVDDVITTGGTANELARVLKRAGLGAGTRRPSGLSPRPARSPVPCRRIRRRRTSCC